MKNRVYGSLQAELYEQFVELYPDRRMRFMNHGYARLDGSDDFAALTEEERLQSYSVNLVRELLHGVEVTGKRVLDVGCGRGGAVCHIARQLQPSEIVGLDFCGANLAFCRRNSAAPSAVFVRGDAHFLPFQSASFDVVLNIESSHCYPDRPRFFREVHRVLKRHGRFCYTDVTTPAEALTCDRALRRSGLRLIRKRDITANVARALHLDRATRERFMNGMIDPAVGNQRAVEHFLRFFERLRGQYLARRNLYSIWIFGKDY